VTRKQEAETIGACPGETLGGRRAVTDGALPQDKIDRKEAAVAVACLAAKGISAFKDILTYA
jgi:hypothetical protein